MSKNKEKLRANFELVSGEPFKYFFCPILHVDEDVEHCEGHIVNEAFPKAPRTTIIQRKDVDNFYSHVESEFLKIKYKGTPIEKVVSDDKARRVLKPKILLDEKPHEFYALKKNNKKSSHSTIFVSNKSFVIKASAEELKEFSNDYYDFFWQANLQPFATASLIKAAYLTLFYVIGYSYVFSNEGTFVGRSILGKFFIENQNKEGSVVRSQAKKFFLKFREMARPVLAVEGWSLQGTAQDGKVLICRSDNVVWGVIIFINIGEDLDLQSVIMPLEDNRYRARSAILFTQFLRSEIRDFEVQLSYYDGVSFNLNPRNWGRIRLS